MHACVHADCWARPGRGKVRMGRPYQPSPSLPPCPLTALSFAHACRQGGAAAALASGSAWAWGGAAAAAGRGRVRADVRHERQGTGAACRGHGGAGGGHEAAAGRRPRCAPHRTHHHHAGLHAVGRAMRTRMGAGMTTRLGTRLGRRHQACGTAGRTFRHRQAGRGTAALSGTGGAAGTAKGSIAAPMQPVQTVVLGSSRIGAAARALAAPFQNAPWHRLHHHACTRARAVAEQRCPVLRCAAWPPTLHRRQAGAAAVADEGYGGRRTGARALHGALHAVEGRAAHA